jgi:hypothetical protein
MRRSRQGRKLGIWGRIEILIQVASLLDDAWDALEDGQLDDTERTRITADFWALVNAVKQGG